MNQQFFLIWRNKFLTIDAETLDDIIAGLEGAAVHLRAMRDDGVWLDGGADDDYAMLTTSDPAVAKRYGLEEWDFEEEEFEDVSQFPPSIVTTNGKDSDEKPQA